MAIDKRKLKKCLTGKFGFVEVGGTNHEAVALIVGGRKVATTRFSRSWDEVDNSMLTQIAHQIWVDSKALKQMYECTMERDAYIERLQQEGYLA